MRPPWYDSLGLREWLLFGLVLLVIAVGIKDGRITKLTLAQDKDFLDSLSKVTSVVAIVAGGVLSYFRFFRGRTFSEKLILIPTSGTVVIPNGNLHWLEVEIKNLGSVAIWNHKIRILAQFHGDGESLHEVTEFAKWQDGGGNTETVIDVGESAYEHSYLFVPTDIQAVSFKISVRSGKRAEWSRCLTVSNKMTPTSENS